MDLKKTEMELCIDRYCLRKKIIEENYDYYRVLYQDLFNVLQENFSAEALTQIYITNILIAVLDGDNVLLKFLKTQKPLPPASDLEIIMRSVAYLIWETFALKKKVI